VTLAGAHVHGQIDGDVITRAGSVQKHNVVQDKNSDSVVAAKKKGPECFRCHKTRHCINDVKQIFVIVVRVPNM
jgi:hypothetical protein